MRLITAKQASEIMGVGVPRIYELARCGVIPSVRLGAKQIRFDEDELMAWARRGGATENKIQSGLNRTYPTHDR